MNWNASPGKGSVCDGDAPVGIGAVTYSADGGWWKTESGAAAQIPYKERALRNRAADIESCAGYAVASAQGVGGSRVLAGSHSRRAVGGCQWSLLHRHHLTAKPTTALWAATPLSVSAVECVLNSVFCKNRSYNRKNLYLRQIIIADFVLANTIYSHKLYPCKPHSKVLASLPLK